MKNIKVIADIGSNHNCNFDRAFELIRQAKDADCWGVKFQLFKAESLYEDYKKHKAIKERELPIEWIPDLANEAKKIGIRFGCTPFYKEAVEILAKDVDFLKISSFDILRLDLIDACLDTRKQVMISLGLATNKDLDRIRERMFIYNQKVVLFHCVSHYPANPAEIVMRRMQVIGSTGALLGYSDHTVSTGVLFSAINHLAEYIELHMDLDDKKGYEYSYGHCWTVSKVKDLTDELINYRLTTTGRHNIANKDLELRADAKTGLRK